MLFEFMRVKLDIMTHTRAFLFLFYVTDNPLKSQGYYDIIGIFLTKVHSFIAQALFCRLTPQQQMLLYLSEGWTNSSFFLIIQEEISSNLATYVQYILMADLILQGGNRKCKMVKSPLSLPI